MTIPAVAEKPEVKQGDPPVAPAQTSEDTKAKVKMIPEADHLKALSDVKAESGRIKAQVETLTKERDTFKAQAEQAVKDAADNVKEAEERIAELEDDIANSGNLEAGELSKLQKELRQAKRDAKKAAQDEVKAEKDAAIAEKAEARKEREQFAGTVAEYQSAKYETDTYEVAEEYEGDVWENREKIKAICDAIIEETGKSMARESIEKQAAKILKKLETPRTTAVEGDSGVNNGGGFDWRNMSSDDKIKIGLEKAKRKRR